MRYKRQFKGPRSSSSRRGNSPEGGTGDAAGLTPAERFVSGFVQVLTGGILIFIFLWIIWLA